MNIYHKKNSEIHFRNFGAKFEFSQPIKNLYFQKKIDFSAIFDSTFMKFGEIIDNIKIHHQKFFVVFVAKQGLL